MMSMVHSQMNRAINTAISERVIPEIQNIVSSMSSSGNRDTEASMSPSSQENRENPSGLRCPTANSRISDRTNPLNPEPGETAI